MIDTRQRDLLRAIVEEYVKTARPVGSKSLCKKFKCSSATIRNDMAELESLGYLEKHIYLQEEFHLKWVIDIM